jgi:glucose/arabinose dehydrogenase
MTAPMQTPDQQANRRRRRRGARLCAALAAAAGLIAAAPASSPAQQVQLAPFGGQAYSSPFFVASPPGDASRVFVVEGRGTIRLVKDGVTQPVPFLDVSADVRDQTEGGCECGMFSMAAAPDYATSGLFYVFYTRSAAPEANHYLRIEEFRRSTANPDRADPGSRRIVLEIPHFGASNHNGGQLQFGPDGHLYISTGDGGNTPFAAQDLGSMLGKLLRIDPRGAAPFQYAIPQDNPFRDGAGPNADEVYSYGLRNPYRFSFDRSTGDLVIGDVGGGAWEEIDFKSEDAGRGANFGWPCFEGRHANLTSGVCATPPANHSPPAHEYANPEPGGAAISGGYVIRDPGLPSLAGRYVYADTFGALPGLHTIALSPSGGSGNAGLGVSLETTVSFGQDACGRVYAASLGGPVARLAPPDGAAPCKLAPRPALRTPAAGKAAKRGAVLVDVACDEDCTVEASASIKVKGRKRAKGGKAFTLSAGDATARLQAGQFARLRLALTKKQRRRLARALKARRFAVARIHVAATGGGGGTERASAKVRQRR